ncbi:MAG: hypothetical protein LBE08_04210 [Bifidobacteriaceae bacterium]|jgi:hypothetical protein|nr:hypothetical protein [Bifidobacteriaceae bacterium]
MAGYDAMTAEAHAAIMRGDTTIRPYSQQNAVEYLMAQTTVRPPDPNIVVEESAKIIEAAIEYIAHAVSLGMHLDLELAAHEAALRTEMRILEDIAGSAGSSIVQSTLSQYLIAFGNGASVGAAHPTQIARLVYFISDREHLEAVRSLNSRIYEYQAVARAADIVAADLDKRSLRPKTSRPA